MDTALREENAHNQENQIQVRFNQNRNESGLGGVQMSVSAGLPAEVGKEKQSRQALIALVLGGIAIGCSPIFVRVSEVGPIATGFWRLALALVPLLVLFLRDAPSGAVRAGPRTLSECLMLAAPGVLLGIEMTAWHLSLHMTSVANSTLLVNMAPVFVALGSWLFLRKTMSRVFLLGLALTISGVVVLKGGFAGIGEGDLRGDGVALFAAVLYAGYIMLLSRVRTRFPTMTVMLWSTGAAALSVLPAALVWEPNMVPFTVVGWLVLLGLAWISHAAGQSFITFALAWLPATFSSLTLLLQPVVATLLAWSLLGETVDGWQIVGGLIVIAGIVVAKRG